MLDVVRQLFRARPAAPGAAVPAGERYYVIGDIHGRLDLFAEIIAEVEADDLASDAAETTVVLLGDLVDRGPDSAGVLARAREWQQRRRVRILAGNHEQMFMDSFEDIDVLRHFLKFGGRETALSYGIDRDAYNRSTLEELQAMLRRSVPERDVDFVRSFEDCIEAGGYLFVHAGINPQVPLAEQSRNDLLWIRESFLRHTDPHSHVVVHGHTIFEDVDERANRIGIDTGAYRTGCLTALVLEGERRRYIQAIERDGSITVEKRNSAR